MSKDGINILGLLGVAFIVLKLCHIIDWSWWWVTAPFWGGAAFFLGFMTIAGLLVGIGAIFVAIFSRKGKRG